MTLEEILSLLDRALLNFSVVEKDEGIKDVLQTVFKIIEQHVNPITHMPGFLLRLPQLVALFSTQPNLTQLESLIARAIDFACTPCIDGIPADDGVPSTLQPLVLTACSRWSRRLGFTGDGIDIAAFLKRPEWTPYTVSIIKGLIYASEAARHASRTFLESKASLHHPALHLAPIMWSWLDASDCTDIEQSGTWRKHFNKLTAGILDTEAAPNHRLTCRRAIHAMVQKLSSLRLEFLSDLLSCIGSMSVDTLTTEMLQLGKSLTEILPQESSDFASALLDHALGWLSRSFADPDSLGDGIARALGAMLLIGSIIVC
jgi:hypothetical protein